MACGNHYHTAQWVSCSNGNVPGNAVQGGYDVSDTIFVGRAEQGGDMIPGKIVPTHGVCYVSHAGEEHGKSSYEVLCNPHGLEIEWVHTNGDNIPNGSLQGGGTQSGEPLYIGRVQHEGTQTIGKVQPSHGCLYIPYGGSEHNYCDYEILVCKRITL